MAVIDRDRRRESDRKWVEHMHRKAQEDYEERTVNGTGAEQQEWSEWLESL